MTGAWQRLGQVYLVAVIIFALGPAAVVVFDSVNSATSFPSPFEQFTLRWYAAVAGRPELFEAARNSLVVALLSASVASVIAFLAAYALSRSTFPGRHAVATALIGPLFIPEIVLGLAILQIAGAADLTLNLATLTAAHTLFVMPFALRLTLSGFSRFDFNLEWAARSLGASQGIALRRVVLPLVRPNLIAGFTLAAIMSFVNLPVSMFLTTPTTATLPVSVFAYMESRIDPMIAAVASLVLFVAVIATFFLDRVLKIRIIG